MDTKTITLSMVAIVVIALSIAIIKPSIDQYNKDAAFEQLQQKQKLEEEKRQQDRITKLKLESTKLITKLDDQKGIGRYVLGSLYTESVASRLTDDRGGNFIVEEDKPLNIGKYDFEVILSYYNKHLKRIDLISSHRFPDSERVQANSDIISIAEAAKEKYGLATNDPDGDNLLTYPRIDHTDNIYIPLQNNDITTSGRYEWMGKRVRLAIGSGNEWDNSNNSYLPDTTRIIISYVSIALEEKQSSDETRAINQQDEIRKQRQKNIKEQI